MMAFAALPFVMMGCALCCVVGTAVSGIRRDVANVALAIMAFVLALAMFTAAAFLLGSSPLWVYFGLISVNLAFVMLLRFGGRRT